MSLLGLKNRLDKEKKRDYERRAKNFIAAYQELSKEHEIDIIPTLNYSEHGLFPSIGFKDLKGIKKDIKGQDIEKVKEYLK